MNKLLWCFSAACLCCVMTGVPVAAAPVPKPAPERKAIPGMWEAWVFNQLKSAEIHGIINEAISKMPQKKASLVELQAYASRMASMADYPYFENDTELDRRWFRSFIPAFTQLATIRGRILVLKPGTPEYNAAVNQYEALADRIKGSAKNPRICRDKELMRKQRVEKKGVRDKLEAHYKAMEKANGE